MSNDVTLSTGNHPILPGHGVHHRRGSAWPHQIPRESTSRRELLTNVHTTIALRSCLPARKMHRSQVLKPAPLLQQCLLFHVTLWNFMISWFPRDLKMENVLLDEKKKNLKIIGALFEFPCFSWIIACLSSIGGIFSFHFIFLGFQHTI